MTQKTSEALTAQLVAIASQALAISALLKKAQAEGREPTEEEAARAFLATSPAAVSKGPIWGNL